MEHVSDLRLWDARIQCLTAETTAMPEAAVSSEPAAMTSESAAMSAETAAAVPAVGAFTHRVFFSPSLTSVCKDFMAWKPV